MLAIDAMQSHAVPQPGWGGDARCDEVGSVSTCRCFCFGLEFVAQGFLSAIPWLA